MELTTQWTMPVGAAEGRELKWKLGSGDLPTGVHIDSATKAVTPATGLTVTNPTVNSTVDGFTFTATAVTVGTYSVLFIATRSDGMLNVALAHVNVVAASSRTTLATNALVTLADFRGYMNDESINANVAETIINAVSQAFEEYVECDMFNDTFTAEANDGTGKSYIYLPHWPVTDVDSVVENGVTLTEDTDFFVDYENGILTKATTPWPTYEYQSKWTTKRGGVVVTYDAGYATVPADVKLACLIEAGRAFAMVNHKMFGESSRSVEGTSVTMNTDELLPSTVATLARYARVRI